MKTKYHLGLSTLLIVAYSISLVNANELKEEASNKIRNYSILVNDKCSPYPRCTIGATISDPQQWGLNIFFSDPNYEKIHDDAENSNQKN